MPGQLTDANLSKNFEKVKIPSPSRLRGQFVRSGALEKAIVLISTRGHIFPAKSNKFTIPDSAKLQKGKESDKVVKKRKIFF